MHNCLICRIGYLYQMANFHLRTQIKEQTNAFVTGFRSIISADWLRIFSPLEVSAVIQLVSWKIHIYFMLILLVIITVAKTY